MPRWRIAVLIIVPVALAFVPALIAIQMRAAQPALLEIREAIEQGYLGVLAERVAWDRLRPDLVDELAGKLGGGIIGRQQAEILVERYANEAGLRQLYELGVAHDDPFEPERYLHEIRFLMPGQIALVFRDPDAADSPEVRAILVIEGDGAWRVHRLRVPQEIVDRLRPI